MSIAEIGSVADFATADIRAAQELGYNTAEYQWVKGQVIEASAAAWTSKMTQASSTVMDKAYAQVKKNYESATDPQQKKAFEEMMKSYEEQMEAMKDAEGDDSVTYNRQLLEGHESALNALTQEWSKYEDNEGDAEKAMQTLEESADKAIAESENPADDPGL